MRRERDVRIDEKCLQNFGWKTERIYVAQIVLICQKFSTSGFGLLGGGVETEG
jgi:hypothetical protein